MCTTNSPPGNFPTRKTLHQDRLGLVPMGFTWLGIVLVEGCPNGELSWWRVVLLGSHLVGSHPGGELFWWKLSWCGVVLEESWSWWGLGLGSYPGGNCPGGSCQVGNCPRTTILLGLCERKLICIAVAEYYNLPG